MRAFAVIGSTLLLALSACGGPAKPPASQPASAPAPAAHAGCNCKQPGHAHRADAGVPASFTAAPPVGLRARCPVSGEIITVADATVRSEHAGKHYVFCCPGCKRKFDAEPAKYVK
ncbi:MAG TPA: YHS domain-containing protein [Polyangia bacterium]|jgi:Cu+-exporting ATPase